MLSETEQSAKPIANGGETSSGLTRRQWLLRLGEAAVLGFSGISPEDLCAADSETPAPADLQAATSSTSSVALPAGLYDASTDHLTHVLMREQRFVTPPPGSETEYAQPNAKPFSPAFFSADEFLIVHRLVWLTLNASSREVPQGEAVSSDTVDEVAEWIDLTLARSAAVREAARSLSPQHRLLALRYSGEDEVQRLETADPQRVWRDGLARLQQESLRLSSRGFIDLTEAQQIDLLQRVLEAPGEPESDRPGPQLCRLLKRQVIEGYYTSQAGLKELDYQGNAFHGESPGCPDK